ncbi:hypothetical protein CR201_G0036098 [Pongo abelii]|uniref:Uncharacterized protein n=1 Tax=Pongo abelii TaxID=9601 RepID=A0A2J8TCF3_PONAB|nr:hypothetical protein CR201_G0036098 [Pongo abelii]
MSSLDGYVIHRTNETEDSVLWKTFVKESSHHHLKEKEKKKGELQESPPPPFLCCHYWEYGGRTQGARHRILRRRFHWLLLAILWKIRGGFPQSWNSPQRRGYCSCFSCLQASTIMMLIREVRKKVETGKLQI